MIEDAGIVFPMPTRILKDLHVFVNPHKDLLGLAMSHPHVRDEKFHLEEADH